VRGLTREQIELRVFSDRIKLDGRYRDNVESIVNTMIEVKKKAAAGIEESDIQTDLRWCFEKIRPQHGDKVDKDDKTPVTQQTLLSRMVE
jgi:hypothetical protein